MNQLVQKQHDFFMTNCTKEESFRRKSLENLLQAIEKREPELYEALKQDLNKSEYEGYLTEVQIVKQEIKTALKSLHRWCKPKRVKTPVTHFPASSRVYREPFGVTLILSPWNYPFQLAMVPLVGAIAGGNCAVLKSSKSSPAVSGVIRRMLEDAFPEEYISCAPDEASYDEILAQKYDLIFFTGSERVGKIVMEAASKHLTPVVLELGGKSPCIVDKSAAIELAAKRIAWGKFLNAGQTCVAPDYVLVDQSVKKAFVSELQYQVKELYGHALENPDYPKVVNRHHFDRLTGYIKERDNVIGGASDEKTNRIEPTIFCDASWDEPAMQEEIFGPVLPVIAYDDPQQMIASIKARSKPLALYLFTKDRTFVQKIMKEVSFGGGCVNDVVMHLANHHLPFGGVGNSGMGQYHGDYSFEAFTHVKGVLWAKSYLDMPFRYPPYRESMFRWVKRLTK
ncbi:aldehyde dehydrogenase [Massiliimalia timonensis]|nr:aldehyde dehydrogenase [Massiliimalia timonensis]